MEELLEDILLKTREYYKTKDQNKEMQLQL